MPYERSEGAPGAIEDLGVKGGPLALSSGPNGRLEEEEEK